MPTVSVILPCRNEELTIGQCIEQILNTFKENKINGEIIVSDSSTDFSSKIIKKYDVIHLKHDKIGYGIACMEAIKEASGKYIIIGDSDGTYDFSQIPLFLKKLKVGYDLVLGSRIKGDIKKGAMPMLHKYVGNPFLSGVLNIFFKTDISDAHTGFRAIKKDALDNLNLKTTGMEFASEMIIKAANNRMYIEEVPITYYPRIGKSSLKSFSDGWRHLRFMLMFSPTYLFFIPGTILMILGFIISILMLKGTILVNGKDIGLFISAIGSLLSILGYQIINLGLYSKIYAIHTGFVKEDRLIDFIAKRFPLEKGILLSFAIISGGVLGLFLLIFKFMKKELLVYSSIFFWLTLFIIGLSSLFSVFFISMMLVEKK